jgi:hypothetical protein
LDLLGLLLSACFAFSAIPLLGGFAHLCFSASSCEMLALFSLDLPRRSQAKAGQAWTCLDKPRPGNRKGEFCFKP